MRIAPLLALPAVLLLAACSGDRAPPPVVSAAPPQPRAGTAWGIDLAYDTTRLSDQLRRGGIQFVARYYRDPTSHYPRLTAAEAQRLSALGLNIVAVWESHSANPAYFSYARGYWDAVKAAEEASAAGQPAGSAIYFGVDFNARGWQLASVEQYFRGVDVGMAAVGRGRAPYRIGVYGSGAVCGVVKGTGLAQFAWLSNAVSWAGVRTYRNWNIRQGTRFATLPFDHDADEAWGSYGGFRVAVEPMAPAAVALNVQRPIAAPVPAPPREHEWVTAALDRIWR